jgi:diguanylate cyclase (GGDEF)-like protein
MIELVTGALIGAAATWFLRRGSAGPGRGVGPAAGAHLLPEPALRWLLRAHGAVGVWMSELAPGDEGPKNERVIDAERLTVAQIAGIDRRLERARDLSQSGAERLEGGMFVYRSHEGFAVGLLVPEDSRGPEGLAAAEDDLDRLLEGIRRRPQIVALAQAQADEGSLETVASVALRLAYQLERITGAAAIVGVIEPSGIHVVGASGNADRRLLDIHAHAESGLARVASGQEPRALVHSDPTGAAVADRRQRQDPVLVLPIAWRTRPVGAVALWLPSGREPAGAQLAEILEAIAGAAPRLERAVQKQGFEQQASVDALTGLENRRALDRAMQRHATTEGALVYADIDHFKLLNDTLGHAAGDAALIHFSRLVREQIRAADTAARIGGEEFALWLPGASLEVGVRIAERVRLKLGTTAWDWQGRVWPLSASFGVAACPETSRRIENLPAQADSALYVAKRSGRDRVEGSGIRDQGSGIGG